MLEREPPPPGTRGLYLRRLMLETRHQVGAAIGEAATRPMRSLYS